MYLVVWQFQFKAEGSERALELMDNIVRLGRTETGINHYSFYPNPDVDDGYFLLEQ